MKVNNKSVILCNLQKETKSEPYLKYYFSDPYQLRNTIGNLPAQHEDWMLAQLIRLKGCAGKTNCWTETSIGGNAVIQPNIWEHIFGK